MMEPARTRPITGWSLANGLGGSTGAILDGIFAGHRALRVPPAPFDRPVPTVCLALRDLPPLPAPFAREDTRLHRIAWRALVELEPCVARARERWGASRVAVVVGTSTGGLHATETAFRQRDPSGRLPPWFDFGRMHPVDAVARFVAAVLGLEGPTYAISTACSSSAKVLASALRLLSIDVCDAVLVGGVDSLCHTTLLGFHALGLLSAEPCKPFDVRRAGINVSEGAAFLMVERRGPAGRDSAGGGVALAAVGEASEAFHLSSPEPTGRGARAAMEDALHRAGLAPEEVDYVNAHATATPQNDGVEAAAILSLFGGGAAVSSTKGSTGHLLGAAGATEAIVCAAAIERGAVPPTVGCEEMDPLAAALDLVRAPRHRAVRAALSNSFAFGGSCASVLLRGAS